MSKKANAIETNIETLIATRAELEALLAANMKELQTFLPDHLGKVFTINGKPFAVVKSRTEGQFGLRQAVSDKVLAAMG